MNVDITGARIYFTIPIFGGIPITATIVNSLLVTLIIIGLSIFLTRNLKVRAVSRRQVVAEFLVETAQNFVLSFVILHLSAFTLFRYFFFNLHFRNGIFFLP